MKLLEARPHSTLLLLEKEAEIGRHQTSHNSGVVHAGIYYPPGSLKATLCRAGLQATTELCHEHGIAIERCGKLIVATNRVEEDRIAILYERATSNGIKLEWVGSSEIQAIEPNIIGTSALLSPETSIVDYHQISRKIAELIVNRSATVLCGQQVDSILEMPGHVEVGAGGNRWQARQLVVCGGLQADRLARLAGIEIDFQIVPFRGEYYQLPASKYQIVNHLIYPAPNPELPFLGIHLTRMIDGSVTVGPNAVIGLAREGYSKLSINVRDTASFALFPGFWNLVMRNLKHAAKEVRGSLWRSAYLEECRKYCPQLELSDLLPYRAGIRAQVVNSKGKAIHDFLFRETERMLHVCNAPSPAATSAFPIGQMIAKKCVERAVSA
jgi:L-2-hydroxyglutarate oxidase